MPSICRKEGKWSQVGKLESTNKDKPEDNRPWLECLYSKNKFEILRNLNSTQQKPAYNEDQPSVIKDKDKSDRVCSTKRAKKTYKDQSSGKNSMVIHKIKKTSPVETYNPFQILEETSEEDLAKLIERARILGVPRRNLKKCRYCSCKKRKCNLNPEQCFALKQIWF